jgi:NTP pyrophosphatase (non-canonical NTP hydrolase)
MSELVLSGTPVLADYQRYIADMVQERGFGDESLAQAYMLFVEEVGELAKAARKKAGLKMDTQAAQQEAEHEAADVFILFLDICNKLDIDLEKAFRAKEEINKQRTWS